MNKIKFFRQQKAITVKELSKLSGVATGYISDLENENKNNPSTETMKRISEALDQNIICVFFPEELNKGGMLNV
ncbi:helix-turn-helix transcriptional regulator [Clostridium sporogenes]|uniref:helix-turn-helix domain-containing protein n=1 Tax=Clostridium sporogenes TaxID=1509 RepID=UPI00024BA4F1|nr:helix-turn-helix transcriptional regulator [Clostridium sporogenes]EHN15807.1 MerR family transcriptional regulator [Clostridium sporogenes PA 3679]MDU4599257.1 helix-turn-helix transcriptional regulator [Clostridium sporogenes]NFH33588.1 helix-turn-helix transcriptional regulator [Clostridium sporogenes]NFL21660.1 helix-turn-helix transcriptional regulator [Clostridium sporogenes]NFN75110.1 helix-turn-helix transcriptional regulator [Clostridium sporogenes]